MIHSKCVLIRDDDAGSPGTLLRLTTSRRQRSQHGVYRHDSKFPEGYTLWQHKKGVETDPANPQTDAYLHGAPLAVFHDGVRRACNMAHAQESGQMALQVLHACPGSA